MNVANLLNSISYKQSYDKLNELLYNTHLIRNNKLNIEHFSDPNLVIRLFTILNAYKYRQPLRKYIFSLMESFFSTHDNLDKMENILDSIGKNMF